MKTNNKIIILGILIGMVSFFALPLFPVPLPNRIGEYGGLMWNSGLMQLGLSLKSFLLLEGLGGVVGLLGSIIYVGVQD